MTGTSQAAVLLGVVAAIGADPLTQAAEWSAAPSLSWSLDSNSNRRLDFKSRNSQAMQLDGSVALRRAMETLDLAITPRFSVLRFQGESVLDSDDYGLALDMRRSAERTALRLQASASRDGTLTSELRDTGIIEGHQRRQALVASLSASCALSNRLSLSANAGWQGISFSNAAASGLENYNYPSASTALSWRYSTNTTLSLQADASELRAPAIALTSRNHSERITAETQVSERFSTAFSLGRSSTLARSASDSGPVYSASLKWRSVLTELSLTARRDVTPTGRGVLVTRDEIGASVNRRLSERFSVAVNADYDRNEDLLFGLIRNNRRYWSSDAALQWRVTETWSVTGRLASSRARFDVIDDVAQSRSVAIVFAWTPFNRALSR